MMGLGRGDGLEGGQENLTSRGGDGGGDATTEEMPQQFPILFLLLSDTRYPRFSQCKELFKDKSFLLLFKKTECGLYY